MILQMIKNGYVKFGGHVEIQLSYIKILQLEVPKKAPILKNPPCFQEGFFWTQHGLRYLGIKYIEFV
jgi:hypothetical protein